MQKLVVLGLLSLIIFTAYASTIGSNEPQIQVQSESVRLKGFVDSYTIQNNGEVILNLFPQKNSSTLVTLVSNEDTFINDGTKSASKPFNIIKKGDFLHIQYELIQDRLMIKTIYIDPAPPSN